MASRKHSSSNYLVDSGLAWTMILEICLRFQSHVLLFVMLENLHHFFSNKFFKKSIKEELSDIPHSTSMKPELGLGLPALELKFLQVQILRKSGGVSCLSSSPNRKLCIEVILAQHTPFSWQIHSGLRRMKEFICKCEVDPQGKA